MTVGPVILRELRVQARRKGLRKSRVTMAAVVALAVGGFFLGPAAAGSAVQARTVLGFIGSALMLWAVFIGAGMTVDAISREYREQTLGFLMLSPLRGWEVALGKLAAHTLASAYAFMAAAPALAIPILAGGATGWEAAMLSLAVLDALLLGGAVGLYYSSGTSETRRAWNRSSAALILLVFVFPTLAGFGATMVMPSVTGAFRLPVAWIEWLGVVSPSWLWFAAMGRGTAGEFALGMGVHLAMVVLFVAAAGRRIRRRSTERPSEQARPGWRERWRRWQLGSAEKRAAVRARWLEQNPLGWLTCRFRFRWVWPMVIAVLPMAAFLTGWVLWPQVVDFEFALGSGLFLAHLLVKLQMATSAVVPLLEERRRGTLEGLLVAPLTERDFMRAQWAAMRQEFAPAVGLILAATAVFIGSLLVGGAGPASNWLITIALLAGVNLGVDWRVLTWVGMWCATWRNNPQRAASNAGGFVLVAPWLGLAACWFLAWVTAFVWPAFGSFLGDAGIWLWIGLWCGLGWVNALFWSVLCRRILSRRLRALLERVVEK